QKDARVFLAHRAGPAARAVEDALDTAQRGLAACEGQRLALQGRGQQIDEVRVATQDACRRRKELQDEADDGVVLLDEKTPALHAHATERSEERRVGKECRTPWETE